MNMKTLIGLCKFELLPYFKYSVIYINMFDANLGALGKRQCNEIIFIMGLKRVTKINKNEI